ncbi:PH domain-containing protein [Luteimonas sp. SDU101]|uniref:PH domain-containing protein n=1 Tax=Luteimonas sp. SDU101 TaxID=3422593 RepID=UPI003EBB0FF8
MGLLDALLGNAGDAPIDKVAAELAPLLVEGERVERGFILFRDLFVFTSHRLVMVNKQGLTGSKVETLSIPYRSIVSFSVENAGSFDMDSELRLWISGQATPITRTFGRKVDATALLGLLSARVLG